MSTDLSTVAAARRSASLLRLLLLTAAFRNSAAQPGPEVSRNSCGLSNSFNPTMSIVIVVLICAFFFLGFFCIYFRQYAGGRSPGVDGLNARERGPSSALRGLDSAVIGAFPILVFSSVRDFRIGKVCTIECAVCLSEFESDECLRHLPKCDHVFHLNCIDAWLASRTTCPVCRVDLSSETGNPDGGSSEMHASNEWPIHESSRSQGGEWRSRSQVSTNIFEGESAKSTTDEAVVKFSGKFPRSHSTGHSLSHPDQPRQNWERYTLRLPEHVRRDLTSSASFRRPVQ